MQMVAASKMRRAQERGLAGRPYSEHIQKVIANLAALPETQSYDPLLDSRPVKRIDIVHITSDRGLCGGLNTNMNRMTANFLKKQDAPVNIIAVGRKGLDFMRRAHRDVTAEFTGLGDRPGLLDTLPIAQIIIDDYCSRRCDAVYLAYTRFYTTLTQKPEILRLLPVEPARIPRAQNVEYIYEPGPQEVLAQLLRRFVEMQVYHALLESIASEESAKMVAMKSATDNAKELVDNLTLLYNKARQDMITKEILDIAGGAAALE
jgi:F-type H+-transporting ATPase subunit gamma